MDRTDNPAFKGLHGCEDWVFFYDCGDKYNVSGDLLENKDDFRVYNTDRQLVGIYTKNGLVCVEVVIP